VPNDSRRCRRQGGFVHSESLPKRNDEMVAVVAAPDAETARQPITTGGTGTVVISARTAVVT
jgi:hypothetical protein